MHALVSKLESQKSKLEVQEAAIATTRKEVDSITLNLVEVESIANKNTDELKTLSKLCKDISGDVKRLEEAVKVYS